MIPPVPRRLAPLAAVAVAALLLAGCSSDDGAAADGRLRVEASFYPLQWVAQEVGGRHVVVSNLTPPGAEPHDLELTPRDVGAIADADVVAYLSGFQPAVDDALAESGAVIFDAAPAADLDLMVAGAGGHAEQAGDADAEEVSGGLDRHFWLDPTRLAAVARSFAGALAERDPDHAAAYRANGDRLTAELSALDDEYAAALRSCPAKELVTSHEAFGYLADRYGLEQVGISGLAPNQEPSSADLARISDFVDEHQVRTIYFETLVSPAVAETVADEAGVRTAVLDPIEGLTEASSGRDYLEVMRSNLEHLQAGQPCP